MAMLSIISLSFGFQSWRTAKRKRDRLIQNQSKKKTKNNPMRTTQFRIDLNGGMFVDVSILPYIWIKIYMAQLMYVREWNLFADFRFCLPALATQKSKHSSPIASHSLFPLRPFCAPIRCECALIIHICNSKHILNFRFMEAYQFYTHTLCVCVCVNRMQWCKLHLDSVYTTQWVCNLFNKHCESIE